MARVIRGSRPVVPGPVVDAKAEAARIREGAEAEAREILDAARSAAASVTREADSRGRAAAEGGAAALLAEAAALRDGALAAAENEASRLALAAARSIVAGELALAPEKSLAIVRDVLSRARRARRIRVEVHPEDAEEIRGALPGVEIIPRDGLARGGCIVRTELGTLDARLEVRFEALERALESSP